MTQSLIYSDGSVEEKIASLLQQGRSDSEIMDMLSDPAVFHTFSPERENILSWYPFKKTDHVLEVGAGMGAVTGLLCRSCEHVVSLEMSPQRADVIRLRHKKYENLEVISEDINAFFTEEKFDHIVVIGVLEYAGIISCDRNPYVQMLEAMRNKLKPDGTILLAIENRFGLKYWCGAQEDHTGVPFEGIAGYDRGGKAGAYEKPGVATFDKYTLSGYFEKAGYQALRYYYPMPDYKFTTAIFSDDHLPKKSDIDRIKFSYSKDATLIANEQELYKHIIENGLFGFFANSFLVEAGMNALCEDYVVYASQKRDYAHQHKVITRIDKRRHVEITAGTPRAIPHLEAIFQNYCDLKNRGIPVAEILKNEETLEVKFIEAPLARDKFQDALKREDEKECLRLIDLLREMILRSSDEAETENTIAEQMNVDGSEMGRVLSRGYVDMTFNNAFVVEGSLLVFDQEWVTKNIPVSYILWRAIQSTYIDSRISKAYLLSYAGIDDKLAMIYSLYESKWLASLMEERNLEKFDPLMYHKELTLSHKLDLMNNEIERVNAELCKVGEWGQRTDRELNQVRKQLDSAYQERDQMRKQLDSAQQELDRILNSHSWKMMQPVWKLRDIIVPHGSRRRKLLKLVWKVVRHPKRALRAVNRQRLKKLFSAVKNGDMLLLEEQFTRAMGGTDIPVESIKIIEAPAGTSFEDYEKLSILPQENPLVSIVIPVYNQFGYTYLCIKSILQNSGTIPYEIIVADDCSTDLTQRIEEIIEGVFVAKTQKNLRFLLNCNNAAKQARGKYILFLNNDTQVQENWLHPLVELIERDEKIGMVGSKLVYPDGHLQEAGGILWRDGSAWNYGNRQDPSMPQYNYVKEVDYISGAAIMIRRSLWEQLGGFDERFAPAYCEDSDLAFMVRDAGYQVLYQPKSVVVHFEGVSNGTDTSTGLKAYQVTNQKKFCEKWKHVLAGHNENAVNVFNARDKSIGRKTVLFVDHYVPTYDKDAGSRTVFAYLKMFVEQGFNVKFIGDNFYQHEPYTTTLQQMGIEVLYGSWYAQNWKQWIKENADCFDYAFLNRPHISVNYIDFLRENTNAKIIYYGHDLHFLRVMREFELTGEKRLIAESESWKEKELSLMRKADMSYYPSEIEAQAVHEIDPAIRVKAIPAYLFDDVKDAEYLAAQRKDLFFIGGFGHGPNVDAVKWLAKEIMPLLREKLPDIQVHIAGSNMPKEIKSLEGNGLIMEGAVSDERLAELYAQCRLNIVPLRYGAGIKGKVVESMRFGLPVVTTSCGAEGIMEAEEILTVADTAESIATQIAALYADEGKLAVLSAASVEYVRRNYSADNAVKVLDAEFGFTQQ